MFPRNRVFSYSASTDRERRFCSEICVEKLASLRFRRYLVEIESEYKNALILKYFFFCASSVVSGSVPPKFKPKFAVVHEIRSPDGLSAFRLAQLAWVLIKKT